MSLVFNAEGKCTSYTGGYVLIYVHGMSVLYSCGCVLYVLHTSSA